MGTLAHGIYDPDPLDGVDEEELQQQYSVDGPERIRGPRQTGAGHLADEDDDEGWEDEPQAEPGASDSDIDTLSTLSFLSNTSNTGPSLTPSAARRIHRNILPNIRHRAIPVARHEDPFASRPTELQDAFFEALNEACRDPNRVPAGYGVREDEWDDGEYSQLQYLSVGARREQMPIHLPYNIWYPRAVFWAKGIDLLSLALAME